MDLPPDRLPPPKLPPADIKRWTARRKAAVLEAIAAGVITAEEACRRWRLSPTEVEAWQWVYTLHGLGGLHTTRIQTYRAALRARRRHPDGGGDHDGSTPLGSETAAPGSPRSKSSSTPAPVSAANSSTRWWGSGERLSYAR